MKKNILPLIAVFSLIVCFLFVGAAKGMAELKTIPTSKLSYFFEKEIERAMESLKDEEYPPYFISYSATRVHSYTAQASFGALTADEHDSYLLVDIEVRVGDYSLDNTRQIRGSNFEMGSFSRGVYLPLDEGKEAVRVLLWEETDRRYKAAVERYLKVISNRAVKVKEDDSSADFSKVEVIGDANIASPMYAQTQMKEKAGDFEEWKARVQRLSALFNADPTLFSGDVSFRFERWERLFISSEKAIAGETTDYYRVYANGKSKADDGMSLPLYKTYFAFDVKGLPSEEEMKNDIERIVDLCGKLRQAPVMETYSGPAMLSGEAAGVFFHEIFGHRIEGHRQKDVNSSQTFKDLVGEAVLPDFIDVVFDPTEMFLGGVPLSGHYRYDDQGVRGQKVLAVENGIFKNFLMSRSPIEGFPTSNGHGRKQPGNTVVSRQSNLLVQAKKTVPFDSLRTLLIEECKKQNKPFGLYFVEIEGGFTFTQRTIPNAFNVLPLLVYKIYADGRPDELVRGVDLIGTPLTTFKLITAAADDMGVFNGVCGAESGWVPVSACSPSLLVSNIEVQKKAKSQAQLPILPPPALSEKQ